MRRLRRRFLCTKRIVREERTLIFKWTDNLCVVLIFVLRFSSASCKKIESIEMEDYDVMKKNAKQKNVNVKKDSFII